MRVALCLYGLSAGKNDKGDEVGIDLAYRHYKKHILEKNNVDVFIHTWSDAEKENLIKLYNPVKATFEPQIMFDSSPSKLHSTKSRWYSSQMSIDQKRQYEQEHDFKYDCVMISRFDVVFFTDIIFVKINMKYFYSSNWANPAKDVELLDFWFFSNSMIMDEFAKLYDHIDDYLKEDQLSGPNDEVISNHILARRHLQRIGVESSLKYYGTEYRNFWLAREVNGVINPWTGRIIYVLSNCFIKYLKRSLRIRTRAKELRLFSFFKK